MSAPVAVTAGGASLLETDPALRRLLDAPDAADVGSRRLLPVLALSAGGPPPPADTVGEGTLGLAVLSGVLLREAPAGDCLFGPGDRVEPWGDPAARWSACTRVRATIIGRTFLRVVAPWPEISAYALGRPRAGGMPLDRAGDEPAQERLRALFWRLAARWGSIDGDGIAVPLPLAPAALAALLGLAEAETAAGLRALERAGAATTRADGTWLLRTAGRRPDDSAHAVRDDLRERVADTIAQARATVARSAELLAEASVHQPRGEERPRR